MIKFRSHYLFLPCVLLLFSSILSCQKEPQEEKGSEEIVSLPLQTISLDDMRGFSEPSDNWSIVGNVQSDYQTEHSMITSEGSGVLVNLASGTEGEHIFTEMDHGDFELKVDFLVPKGSNSGIYFQGRYEAQILDSWGVYEPEFTDVGGIYERWDESQPEGERGFEGSAPKVNAALAPGLWQEYHILFRAPRFDEQGNKVENARFEWVYLNGARVQEDVEVTGPTRAAAFDGEQELAPLMFQGDHGPVAFRNLRYKSYSQTDSLTLRELEYKIYEYEGDRTPVDFEDLTLIDEGTTDAFNPSDISPVDEHYAITFTGDLHVPVSGEYLFQTQISNGGNLYINGEMVVENTGEFDQPRLGNIIHLTEGTHQLEVTFFQIMWGTRLSIWYEGPNMERRSLASAAPGGGSTTRAPTIVSVDNDYPEMIGGFVNYRGEKRTHTLSVGHPEGIHYNYDLQTGALLNFWRDPFADVTQMWVGRGHEQLLAPLNAAIEESSGIPVTTRGSSHKFENYSLDLTDGVQEYILNDEGRPVFLSTYNNIRIEDEVNPNSDDGSFIRSLNFTSDSQKDGKLARIAQGKSIELLDNGLYRVNGNYYVRILESGGEEPEILSNGELQALFLPILQYSNEAEIEYKLIW